jgi:hypothetical protein
MSILENLDRLFEDAETLYADDPLKAGVLRCWGRMAISLESLGMDWIEIQHYGQHFDVRVDSHTSYVANLQLKVRGEIQALEFLSTSDRRWPLYLRTGEENMPALRQDGELTDQFLDLLRG